MCEIAMDRDVNKMFGRLAFQKTGLDSGFLDQLCLRGGFSHRECLGIDELN
jgi:hypothetical protein